MVHGRCCLHLRAMQHRFLLSVTLSSFIGAVSRSSLGGLTVACLKREAEREKGREGGKEGGGGIPKNKYLVIPL